MSVHPPKDSPLQHEDEGKLVRAVRAADEDDQCRPPQGAHGDCHKLRTTNNLAASVLDSY